MKEKKGGVVGERRKGKKGRKGEKGGKTNNKKSLLGDSCHIHCAMVFVGFFCMKFLFFPTKSANFGEGGGGGGEPVISTGLATHVQKISIQIIHNCGRNEQTDRHKCLPKSSPV